MIQLECCPPKPIGDLVEQFDLVPCAVTMRVDRLTGCPTFGGSGATRMREQADGGSALPLELTPFAFSQLTGVNMSQVGLGEILEGAGGHLGIVDGVAIFNDVPEPGGEFEAYRLFCGQSAGRRVGPAGVWARQLLHISNNNNRCKRER